MSQQQILQATATQCTPQLERHYAFDSLPDGPFARYMILRPASTDTDPLVCALHTSHLDEIPPFEALSYAWGVLVENRKISCNGKVIHITANVSRALRQVRLIDEPRTLWVDAICINQADSKEKGHQVSLMQRIYNQSNCTLISLGVSDRVHAPILADLVADVDCMIQDRFGRADFNWRPNSFPIPGEEEPLLSHSGWESFGILLQQPWFRRGWVVQEAALGPVAVVLWADTEIDWLKLLRVYIWRIRRALKLPNRQDLWLSDLHLQGFNTRHNREAITFRPESDVEPLTFLETLDCARWLDVTDPRDRIYALLGLRNPNELLPALRPNYEVPYILVYRDFACEYLRLREDLDILHFVHNDGGAVKCEFASWIPRWDMRLQSSYTGTLNNYSRSSRRIISPASSPEVRVSQDQTTLKVRAIIMDTVTFTGPGFDKDSTTLDDVASLWESISKIPTPFPYPCSPLRAFLEIFRCGVYRGRLKEWVALEAAYARLLQHEPSQEDVSSGSAESFHRMRMEDVHNRSFVMSKRGYYGLAPRIAKEGDVCCIIFGTRSPFILRRTDRAGHYKVVGSVLVLSKEPDHNGYPDVLGSAENCEDWKEWGLEEKAIFLC